MAGSMPNIGILGAGGIAALSHLPEIAEVEDLRVTHICGRTESRLRLLCERFDVPRYSTSWGDLLDDLTLDGGDCPRCRIRCMPKPVWRCWIADCTCSCKSRCARRWRKPTSWWQPANCARGQIVYCRPSFSAVVYEMRRQLAARAIGTVSGALARHSHGGPEVYYAEVSDSFDEPRVEGDFWFYDADQAGGGALIDMGVYAIANIVALLGKVASVTARMRTVAKPTELEDSATLILEMANGALATAETGWCDPARSAYLRVHGTAGKLHQTGDEIAYIRPGSYEREWAAPIVEQITPPPVPNQHAEWLRCMERGEQPALSNLWTARHITEIMLAAVVSNAEGKRVPVRSQPRTLLPAP